MCVLLAIFVGNMSEVVSGIIFLYESLIRDVTHDTTVLLRASEKAASTKYISTCIIYFLILRKLSSLGYYSSVVVKLMTEMLL